MLETGKPKVKLSHTQEPDRFGNIYIFVQLYDQTKTDIDIMQSNYTKRYCLLVGRNRLRCVSRRVTEMPDGLIYAYFANNAKDKNDPLYGDDVLIGWKQINQ